jgi:hypothetical protein
VRKAVRLACWKADDVRGRKFELENFLSEHGIDICLLRETRLESGRALRFANYVCHWTDRLARGGGTVILFHRGIDHYAVPVWGLQHLEASVMHVVLANRSVKVLAAYLLPTRPLTESDLAECLSGDSPVLMAGNLNVQNRDCSSRLTTARGSLLCDYANRNSCLVYGLDSPTTNPYNSNATPDVLDVVVVKDLVLPVHLTVCHALSSDHLPVLIDTICRASFHDPLDRPDFTRTDWATFQARLEARLPGNPAVHDEEEIDKCDVCSQASIVYRPEASATRRYSG